MCLTHSHVILLLYLSPALFEHPSSHVFSPSRPSASDFFHLHSPLQPISLDLIIGTQMCPVFLLRRNLVDSLSYHNVSRFPRRKQKLRNCTFFEKLSNWGNRFEYHSSSILRKWNIFFLFCLPPSYSQKRIVLFYPYLISFLSYLSLSFVFLHVLQTKGSQPWVTHFKKSRLISTHLMLIGSCSKVYQNGTG